MTAKRARRILGLGFLALCVGCMSVGSSFHQYGLQRAAFELRCDRRELKVYGLNVPLNATAIVGSQVGVEGCDQRVVYVLTQAGWMANSVSGQTPPEAPPPPPPPRPVR